MADAIERSLDVRLTDRFGFGQILIRKTQAGAFVLSHRDDEGREGLSAFRDAEDASEIAKYDDNENYRPLKTAPNLRHGWRLELATLDALQRALDGFYPGRLAVFAAWKENRLARTSLRETVDRQSGMYRVAAKISDEQINDLVGSFCRSDGGCLRTILWKRDASGASASAELPSGKFDTTQDQSQAFNRPRSATTATTDVIPLLCQEACNLLVAEARKIVRMASAASLAPE